jgi:SEC-C motif domain protein
MICPCGSKKTYQECCEPIVSQKIKPSSAEQLMRSRYSAYAMGNGKYLVDTTFKESRIEEDAELIVEHAKTIVWLKLEVVTSNHDSVEFKAYYNDKTKIHLHHETSSFILENGQWYYNKGVLYATTIGRNESCPCGSGKKFKRCCA